MSAMSASGPIDRARSRSWAALMSVSSSRYGALVGKGRLHRMRDLVLVQAVVRRRRALVRPQARDRDVAGVPAPAARDRGALPLRRAVEVRKPPRRRVEGPHRATERPADPLGGTPPQVTP